MPIIEYEWDDFDDTIIGEYDDNGDVIAEYDREPGLHGEPISQRRSGQSHFFHYDGSGNVVALTDANGEVTDTRVYDAFGEVVESTGATTFPFQYAGQKGVYHDDETANDYAGDRVYEPTIARWLSLKRDRIRQETFEYAAVLREVSLVVGGPVAIGLGGAPLFATRSFGTGVSADSPERALSSDFGDTAAR